MYTSSATSPARSGAIRRVKSVFPIPRSLDSTARLLETARATLEGGARIPLADVTLEAPIARPPKFLAVGLNYADHFLEVGERGSAKAEDGDWGPFVER